MFGKFNCSSFGKCPCNWIYSPSNTFLRKVCNNQTHLCNWCGIQCLVCSISYCRLKCIYFSNQSKFWNQNILCMNNIHRNIRNGSQIHSNLSKNYHRLTYNSCIRPFKVFSSNNSLVLFSNLCNITLYWRRPRKIQPLM